MAFSILFPFLLNIISALCVENTLEWHFTAYCDSKTNTTRIYSYDSNEKLCISSDNNRIRCIADKQELLEIPEHLSGLITINIFNSLTYASRRRQYFVKTTASDFHCLPIKVLYPTFGSTAYGVLNISLSVAASQYNAVYFDVVGLINNTIPVESVASFPLLGSDIEPASWFYTFRPVRDTKYFSGDVSSNGNTAFTMSDSDSRTINPDDSSSSDSRRQLGNPTFGYIEFVLTDEEIVKHRRYSSNNQLNDKWTTEDGDGILLNDKIDPVSICIWSPIKMDGQKSIWLEQTSHMDSDRFRFVWILSLPEGGHLDAHTNPEILAVDSVYPLLLQIKTQRSDDVVTIVDSPFNGFAVSFDDLETMPDDGTPAAEAMWGGDITRLYKYVHQRLVAAQYQIDAVTPVWCQRFYATMKQSLQANKCDVVVYGNSRGFSSDVFITDTASILGIPAVTELLNLYLDVDVLPDAIVGPSHYAIEHESISSLETMIASQRQRDELNGVDNKLDRYKVPISRVISPSVDSENRFNPALYRNDSVKDHVHDACRGFVGDASRLCFSVGFVGRLAPEKSPGLFLQAAFHLLHMYPFARFTVVGDGELMESLVDLTVRLGVDSAVSFVGWVGGDSSFLPRFFAGFDVVVNPSLRGWSETFCIANIEAMSMAVPLVTFAVGGVGQYVSEPQSAEREWEGDNNSQSHEFSVGLNAVVVNTATPQAIAKAVFHLIKYPQVRAAIGQAGRDTVRREFNVELQMEKYSLLYSQLHRNSRSIYGMNS